MQQPRVGVGVIIQRAGRVLLGLRRGAHGAGCWAFPGGHLEFMETVMQCAAREVLEETGLHICNVRPGPYTNDCFTAEGKHYITVYVFADCPAGEPELREPERCAAWQWWPWEDLPQPLFLPLRNLLAQGFVP